MIYEILVSWDCTLAANIAEAIYVGFYLILEVFNTAECQNITYQPIFWKQVLMQIEHLKVIGKRPQGWRLQTAMFQNSEV